MDQTVVQFIGALKLRIQDQLQGLGDFPKNDSFEHGVQVGTYRGLREALTVLEAVMDDEVEKEAQR